MFSNKNDQITPYTDDPHSTVTLSTFTRGSLVKWGMWETQYLQLNQFVYIYGGVMVIVAGYGHGDTSSNPRPDWLHFI